MDWFQKTFGSSPGGSSAPAKDPMAEYLKEWKGVKASLATDSSGNGIVLIKQVEDFFFKYEPLIEKADSVLSAEGKLLGTQVDEITGEIDEALKQYSRIIQLEKTLKDDLTSGKKFFSFRGNRLREMMTELSTRKTRLENRRVKPAYIQEKLPPPPASPQQLLGQLNQLKQQGKPPGTGGRRTRRRKTRRRKTRR